MVTKTICFISLYELENIKVMKVMKVHFMKVMKVPKVRKGLSTVLLEIVRRLKSLVNK